MKKALAIGALPVLFLVVTAFQSSNSIPGQLAAIEAKLDSLASQNSSLAAQVAALAAKGPRQFYLTKTEHNGANALTACAPGYHMASLWEIKDTASLRYNTELGFIKNDSGFGPPAAPGWIRTGQTSSNSSNAGNGNCDSWTKSGDSEFGTAVALQSFWRIPPEWNVDPWVAGVSTCSSQHAVWCVQD